MCSLAAPTAQCDAWPRLTQTGGPGAGKGTQCSALAAKHGFAHYSAGDLLRAEVASGSETGNQIKDMLKNGEIVPSEVTIGLLKNAIETTDDCEVFLIDGFPRNIYQGEKFEEEVRTLPLRHFHPLWPLLGEFCSAMAVHR